LNGGGWFLEILKAENIWQLTERQSEMAADTLGRIVCKNFLKFNEQGITSMEQTDSWSWQKLYCDTFETGI
jgi:hypothetical protein